LPLLLEHDLFRKPVSTPDQVRGRLFRDHARVWRVIFSENRFPPRIKSGAGFFGITRYAASFTYSKSPGLLSMPTRGGAIQLANLPGSVT
jgi:hypothetical protein